MLSYLKKNRVLFGLVIITLMASILGFVFYYSLSIDEKSIITNNITLYFNDNNIVKNFFFNHLISNVLIWLLGISIIGIILVLILYFIKVFIFSFELCSLISSLGFKSIISILVYYIPSTIMLIISFFITYYAILLSSYLFRFLFLKTNFSFNYIIKKYLIILFILLLCLVFSSVLSYININYLINFN